MSGRIHGTVGAITGAIGGARLAASSGTIYDETGKVAGKIFEPSGAMIAAGAVTGAVLTAAAWYLIGRAAAWYQLRKEKGHEEEKNKKIMEIAKQQLAKNPKFKAAALKKSKKLSLKEDLKSRQRFAKQAGYIGGITGAVGGAAQGGFMGAVIGGAVGDGSYVGSAVGAATGAAGAAIPLGILTAAVYYYVGKAAAWIHDAATGELGRERAEAIMNKAKERLRTDPEFAAKVKARAAAMKKKSVKESKQFGLYIQEIANSVGGNGVAGFSATDMPIQRRKKPTDNDYLADPDDVDEETDDYDEIKEGMFDGVRRISRGASPSDLIIGITWNMVCPYCGQLLRALSAENIKFTAFYVDTDTEEKLSGLYEKYPEFQKQILAAFKKSKSVSTVPQVYYKGKYIGGTKEFVDLYKKFAKQGKKFQSLYEQKEQEDFLIKSILIETAKVQSNLDNRRMVGKTAAVAGASAGAYVVGNAAAKEFRRVGTWFPWESDPFDAGAHIVGGMLLAGGVAYVLGRGAAWLVDKARGKIDQEQAEKAIQQAKQKLQSDPEFAAKVRKKANTLKESLRAPKGKKISVFGSMNKPKKISTKKAKKSQSVMGAIDAVSKVGGILG